MKYLHTPILSKLALFLCAWMSVFSISAQIDRVYASGKLTLNPGGDNETQYFTVCLENANQDYAAYQMDIVLPPGLEISYYEGEPDIYIENVSLYPNKRGTPYHTLAIDVNHERIRVICADIDGNRNLNARNGELFVVGVVSSPYLKPGDVSVELKNVMLSNTDATGPTYNSMGYSSIGTATSNGQVNLQLSTTNKFGTIILPFDVVDIPTSLKAYSCNSLEGENLVLQPQSILQAFTPYILYAENGFEGKFTGEIDAAKHQLQAQTGYLIGTLVSKKIDSNQDHYVLQNQGEGAMFYRVGETAITIPAGRCWITLPQDKQNTSALQLHLPTNINDAIRMQSTEDIPTYDLSGRRIHSTSKGIFVVGGKKVIK